MSCSGALTLGLLAFGCSASNASKSDAVEDCASVEQYFSEVAWPTVVGSNCVSCHTPGGPAQAGGAAFLLLPPGYPRFLESNLQITRDIAAYEVAGKSILLRKPLGELQHGGGMRISEGTDEYKALEGLIALFDGKKSCSNSNDEQQNAPLNLLDAAGTFRKASLHFGGRIPTKDEQKDLEEEGDAALVGLLSDLMQEDAFFERLKEIFNDQLLVERFLAYTGYAVSRLDERMYPAAGETWDALEDGDLKKRINHDLAHEPLDFIAYLVRQEKPFTELVTANYRVVNRLTAPYLNADVDFDDSSTDQEWREVTAQAFIETEKDEFSLQELPQAGVLTSPFFLNRFPTTPTNRNRHRARMILDIFLGTDILKVGDRPLDPTQAGQYPNPTQNDPSCSSCHEIIDPIGGAFQKFSDNNQEQYLPLRSWYGDMKPAGYGAEQMPVSEIERAPEWLGQRIAGDPRFVYAMVKIIYEGVFGRVPLEYPADQQNPDYSAQLQAWQSQQKTLEAVGQEFIDAEHNLKVLIQALLLSDEYRTESASGSLSKDEEVALSEIGTARFSSPSLLAKKIRAVTGIAWNRSWDRTDELLSDYRILYGGMDSDTILERLSVPNGVMSAVAWRMANEMSCRLVAWEFSMSQSERALLSKVEITDLPAEAEAQIKEQLIELHERILGERLSADSPELERSYALFTETLNEGQGLIEESDSGIGVRLARSCQARTNLKTGEDLEEGALVRDDPDYTIRAWMAVFTYLLSDYRFLYE